MRPESALIALHADARWTTRVHAVHGLSDNELSSVVSASARPGFWRHLSCLPVDLVAACASRRPRRAVVFPPLRLLAGLGARRNAGAHALWLLASGSLVAATDHRRAGAAAVGPGTPAAGPGPTGALRRQWLDRGPWLERSQMPRSPMRWPAARANRPVAIVPTASPCRRCHADVRGRSRNGAPTKSCRSPGCPTAHVLRPHLAKAQFVGLAGNSTGSATASKTATQLETAHTLGRLSAACKSMRNRMPGFRSR